MGPDIQTTTNKNDKSNDLAENVFALPLAGRGKPVKVAFIDGNTGVQEQLISLGINNGVKITVIAGSPEGSLAVKVGDTTLILDKTLSRQILVSE